MPVFTLIIFAGSLATSHGDVAVGDTRETVMETLGEPEGKVEATGQEALSYDRGHVILRNGRVVSHSIVSEEEAQNRRAASDTAREERREEGLALRERILEDPEFAESPRDRLAYLEVFRQRYPDVDVGFEHAVAARQVEAEEQRELRELELRFVEAEKMAELAEEQYAKAPGYVGSGFPLLFGDQFHPGFSPKGKFVTDPAPGLRFQIREPTPLPPTGREQAMPLQSPQVYGPAHHPHQHQRQHGLHHR